MASQSRARRRANHRRRVVRALAIVLAALAYYALPVLRGGSDPAGHTREAGRGGPIKAKTASANRRTRLGIVRIEARHIRAGGVRPGDEFNVLVTVRNHGSREAAVRIDVVREPAEILPFRTNAQTIPPGEDRFFKLHMTAAAKYIIGRHYLRRVYLVEPTGHGVAAYNDATPSDNHGFLRVRVGLYVDLEVTRVRPGRFAMDLRKGRYRSSRQDYEIIITNRGTARYERGARFDLSLYADQGTRRLTRWSHEIDKAIDPGERIVLRGSFNNLWEHPPWIREHRRGLLEGPALPGFPMRLIAILRLPLDLDPARRNNELDTRFLIGMEPVRREKTRLIFDAMRVRSGRLGFTDQ
jgi:hypothetical protein